MAIFCTETRYLGPVKKSTDYLAQIETSISIIYGKYVYTYGYLRQILITYGKFIHIYGKFIHIYGKLIDIYGKYL